MPLSGSIEPLQLLFIIFVYAPYMNGLIVRQMISDFLFSDVNVLNVTHEIRVKFEIYLKFLKITGTFTRNFPKVLLCYDYLCIPVRPYVCSKHEYDNSQTNDLWFSLGRIFWCIAGRTMQKTDPILVAFLRLLTDCQRNAWLEVHHIQYNCLAAQNRSSENVYSLINTSSSSQVHHWELWSLAGSLVPILEQASGSSLLRE